MNLFGLFGRRRRELLTAVVQLRDQILALEERMDAQFEALAAQVKANTDAESSAVALINGFSARLDAAIAKASAAGATPEQLAALQAETDALKSSADTLAAAVVANTPATPTA